MDDSFEVLEEKVRRAAELVRTLRQKNDALAEELEQTRSRLGEAEEQLGELQKHVESGGSGDGDGEELERVSAELNELLEERDEIKKRIARLVEVLEALD